MEECPGWVFEFPCSITRIYRVSQKSSPPPKKKTFCNIFTQAKYFYVKFCLFVASLSPLIRTNFGRFILIFDKIGVNFSRSTYRLYRFKFRVSASQIALTSSPMMSGLDSPNLSSLDYQVWGQRWSFSCDRSQQLGQLSQTNRAEL